MQHNHPILPYKLEDTYILQFGTFFFYESFVISEIQAGISLDRKMAQMVIDLIDLHYGKDSQIGFISNRLHNYTVETRAWIKFFEMRYRLKGYAIVENKKTSKFKCLIKKLINKSSKCQYENLLEAASWLTSLHVLKKKNNSLYKKLETSKIENKNYFL